MLCTVVSCALWCGVNMVDGSHMQYIHDVSFTFDVILTPLFTSLLFNTVLSPVCVRVRIYLCVCACLVTSEQSSMERKPSHIGAAGGQSHEVTAAVNRAKPLKSPGSADRRDDNKVCDGMLCVQMGWDGMCCGML